MENIFDSALLFIDRWSTILYAVGGVGVLLYLFRAREAARQRRYTPFPIEREEATALLRDSLLILVILTAILATTFYIDRVLLNSPETALDQSTVQREPTAEPTSPVIGSRPTLTPTVTSEVTGTIAITGTLEVTGTVEVARALIFPAKPTKEPPRTPATSPNPSPDASPEATQEVVVVSGAETTTPTPPSTPAPSSEAATPEPTNTATLQPTQAATNTPFVQPTQPPPTPTLPPTNTPAPTPTQAPTAIPTQPPLPTATIAPTLPPPPPVPAANCNTPGVRISSPAHGQTVSGNLSIIGTASIDGFQFYKLEFGQGGSPGSFAAIGDIVRQPVIDGFLAAWPASSFPSGIWTLRLTVVDQTGNFPPPCDIRVVVP